MTDKTRRGLSRHTLFADKHSDDTKTQTAELTVTKHSGGTQTLVPQACPMTDEIGVKTDNAEDGDQVAKDETRVKDETRDKDEAKVDTEAKEPKENKTRSVSFNRDVHVKRFDKQRATRSASSETPSIRKEPFTHLSEQELINEANKVIAQAKGITCTADHPPEKFFSLPHRRKKDDRLGRRNSDEGAPEKTPLGRSTSDVSSKRRKERTSLSTIFRRSQNKSPVSPVVVTTKPVAVVKRSKSDVSDLKSNTKLNTQTKPIRKRSGSETEEFLKSLRNKKTQLSPIIESSPREDYFKKTPPLEVYQKQKLSRKDSKSENQKTNNSKKVNPVEKPPRYKPDKQEPKAPARSKRGKSSEKEKEKSPQITETPKRKTAAKKTISVDEIDSPKTKDKGNNSADVKERIKESIWKIEENVYGGKEMIHSSQQPPDKPPLTRGHTVDRLVKIIREDQSAPPPKSHLISPPNGTNTNQPFSYIKPSVSPDPNLFIRNSSPERVPSPINKMDRGIVYAHVVRDNDTKVNRMNKQTIHKTYSSSKDKYGNLSDEDEGLGYEERNKFINTRMYDYDYKNNEDENNLNSFEGYKETDSPIRPRFREYRLTSFEDVEPTYANEYSPKDKSPDLIDKFRGRADGMDTKKKVYEPEPTKIDLDFNELSHRRQLLESRLNARRIERDRPVEEPIRYLAEDPIYEAEKRMKATERYVNETVRYYRNTLERDGFAENSVTEDYSKYDADNKVKYNTETRTFQKVPKGEVDRREFIDRLEPRYKGDKKVFPPEPEYEPPSLESNVGKPVVPKEEYKDKKYKAKKNLTTSHDLLQSGQKYKGKDEYFGKRKGHYASNPEIAQEREEEYANLPKYADSYHSLRRVKNKDKYKEDFSMRRHDSGDSREYYDSREERSPRRYDVDNRLVDSGIENDFRKDSSGEIHKTRHRKHESDDDVRDTSLFLASERRHTEDNYPEEQIYANGDYLERFKDFRDEGYRKEYVARERSADDGSQFEPKTDRYDKSPSRLDDKISAKPPKAKKLSGLEKMKQLFSRDSSKKSKKEKEVVQPKTRTRVLKSPEHLARDDSEYRRYTDPEPSEIIVRKHVDYECKSDERRYPSSREDLDNIRHSREDLDRGRNSREDLNRPRNSREDLDRGRNSREELDRTTNSREDLDRGRSSREDLDRTRNSRDELDRGRNSREQLDRTRNSREDLDRGRNSREDLDRGRNPREELDKERSYREDIDRGTTSREDLERGRYSRDRLERGRYNVDKYRSSDPRDSDVERKYREDYNGRYDRTLKEERRYKDRKEEKRRYNSSDRESDRQSRPSDGESELRKTRSRGSRALDSPALAERYRERRRLATPSPTPSPPAPRRAPPAPPTSTHSWFKSLDRLARKKGKNTKVEKESTITTDNESTRKSFIKPSKPLNSPAKNLRFFGDTDPDSDSNAKPVKKTTKTHGTLRKTISNSSTGLDELDHSELSSKSYSLSNLHRVDKSESPPGRFKRNLQNISEIQSNSETESQFDRKVNSKPPIGPYERSRSHSSSKTLKGSKTDLRRRQEERGSSSELRASKPEVNRDLKHRRRAAAAAPASRASSTEGESSHNSQRSVVYLHATTVGDIPDPNRLTRNRSRDDVSSINSSNIHARTTTKSFSIFAPWTPRHYSEQQDVHYAQRPNNPKEPIRKALSTKTMNDRPATLQKKKSYSQTTLVRRPQNNRLSSSNMTLYKKPEKKIKDGNSTLRKSVTRDSRDAKKNQSSDAVNRDSDRERVSRSLSMPKDHSKKAGWFKLSSKNKKPEVNTRVR